MIDCRFYIRHHRRAIWINPYGTRGSNNLLTCLFRLYVGEPPKYKVINTCNLLNAILVLCSGDTEEVSRCFSSDWFKKSEVETRCDGADPKTVSEIRRLCNLEDKPESPRLFDQLIATIKEPVIKEGKDKPSITLESRCL